MKIRRILRWFGWAILSLLLIASIFTFVAYWRSTNDCGRSIPEGATRMKAIRFCEYGSPDVLKVTQVEKPVPKDNEVLVKVHAASLNFIDIGVVRGPLLARLIFGLRKPKYTGVARDFAGVVEAVGNGVAEFRPGDEVFGLKAGAAAEYVCARRDRTVLKPANVTFEQASALPLAGLTALQGLRTGNIHSGQKVLINGASGGVGTFALQIAKAFETTVTAVVSSRNVETARTLGADQVIDYTKEDFTKRSERYDLIFDNVNNHSFSEKRRILQPNGICVMAGLGGTAPSEAQMMGRIIRGFADSFLSRFSEQKFKRYITTTSQSDLKFLSELMAAGKIRPFVENSYPLEGTKEAVRYFDEGHTRGKLVIRVVDSTPPSAGR